MASKQDKHLGKIKYETGNTIQVAKKAQKNKDDEFYTSMQDIAQELNHYDRKHYENADIICPCDCDIVEDENIHSIKVEFYDTGKPQLFNPQYTINAVKYLTVFYKPDLFEDESVNSNYEDYIAKCNSKVYTEKEAEQFISEKVTCNFVRYLCGIAKKTGIHSITASGYNPELNIGVKFQDVDYSYYNLCITNPPFSQYGEFMENIIAERDRRINTENPFNFIVLAPFLNRVTPNVGLNLMLRKCYLGYGRRLRLNFENPTKSNGYASKGVACDWITTFRDAQDEIDKTDIHTGITWEVYKNDYYECKNMTFKDGTHPIKIEEITAIPEDYNGWMFASIGVLDILPYSKFEWYGTAYKGYFNTENPSANPFNHKVTDDMCIVGDKKLFHGIVFRRN